MIFCEIVYTIYQKKIIINNFKKCIYQLFQQPQESQDLYIFLLHWLMTKIIFLHKLHRTLLVNKNLLN